MPAKEQGVCPRAHPPVAVALLPFMPNPPAPVTLTSSVAVTSGFILLAACGVASVGPWLLYGSIMVAGELPEASVCASVAPTDTTLTGEPPASASAGTLPETVLKLWSGVGPSPRVPVMNMSRVRDAAALFTFWITIPTAIGEEALGFT